jgi:hypothetical protein
MVRREDSEPTGGRPTEQELLVARKGRNLKPGDTKKWNRAFFKSHGLIQLNGRIQYPGAA